MWQSSIEDGDSSDAPLDGVFGRPELRDHSSGHSAVSDEGLQVLSDPNLLQQVLIFVERTGDIRQENEPRCLELRRDGPSRRIGPYLTTTYSPTHRQNRT